MDFFRPLARGSLSSLLSAAGIVDRRGRLLCGRRNLLLHRDLARRFILPNPREGGMPQDAFLGALGEFHFHHHPRRSPVNFPPPRIGHRSVERGPVLFQPLQPIVDRFDGFGVKPRAHVAAVDELLLLVVISEDQRPEIRPAPFRLGKTPDDKFLPFHAFHFQPGAGPLLDVGTVRPLGDDPLHYMLARRLENAFTRPGQMLAVANRRESGRGWCGSDWRGGPCVRSGEVL